jgi:hypothetical protein
MIGRENQNTRRKPAPMPLCPPQTTHACPDANPGRRDGKPATNHLSYGTAKLYLTTLVSGHFIYTSRKVLPSHGTLNYDYIFY